MDLVGKSLPAVISLQHCLCDCHEGRGRAGCGAAEPRSGAEAGPGAALGAPCVRCSVIAAGSTGRAGGAFPAGCVRSVGLPAWVSCPCICCRCGR